MRVVSVASGPAVPGEVAEEEDEDMEEDEEEEEGEGDIDESAPVSPTSLWLAPY